MIPLPWLTDDELRAATHRRRPLAQARALSAIGVPFKRRPDGTLLVGREAITSALSGAGSARPPPANGLIWSRQT